MRTTSILLAKISFTLALTVFLTYCIMNMGPFKWILQTYSGMRAYVWLLHSWGGSGIEDGEGMLTILAFITALTLSVLACSSISALIKKVGLRRRKR